MTEYKIIRPPLFIFDWSTCDFYFTINISSTEEAKALWFLIEKSLISRPRWGINLIKTTNPIIKQIFKVHPKLQVDILLGAVDAEFVKEENNLDGAVIDFASEKMTTKKPVYLVTRRPHVQYFAQKKDVEAISILEGKEILKKWMDKNPDF